MNLFCGFIITFLVAFSSLAHGKTYDVNFGSKVSSIPPHFVSFAVDMSQVVGRNWWSKDEVTEYAIGGSDIRPFDFQSEKLRENAQRLSPFLLRVGGSLADDVVYDQREGISFNDKHLEGIFSFLKALDSKLVLTLSANPDLWSNREDSLAHHKVLFNKLKKHEKRLKVVEFGNEVNAHPFIYGLSGFRSGKSIALDFNFLKENVAKDFEKLLWSNPGNAFWPRIGEWMHFPLRPTTGFVKEAKDNLDIINWHYYPTQSRRCGFATRLSSKNALMDPFILDQAKIPLKRIQYARDSYSPNASIWLGETGHAQCGGAPGLSDSFTSTLWWIDLLGLMSREGVEVIVRQTLAGGDYGIMDEAFNPRPDYWATVLFKRLVGLEVLDMDSNEFPRFLRAYGFKGHEKSKIGVFINLSEVSFNLNFEDKIKYWLLEHSNEYKMRINNKSPELFSARISNSTVAIPPRTILMVELKSDGTKDFN